MNRTILLVDDDAAVVALLGRYFEQRDWLVVRAAETLTALSQYERERPDVVILDLELPGTSGLELLELLSAREGDAAVIVLTGHGDIPTAVEAMRLGAENFLTKPIELAHLGAATDRALEKVELRRRNRYFAERQASGHALEAMGRSRRMRELAQQIEALAGTDGTVLLAGETGTGKGWVAQMLHSLSARSAAPFVEINCAGLSATFLESELFGYERGAFTDAKARKPGLLEVAEPGTVFLDEVGELAPELQPKLLKVMETRRFRRLGGTREIEADVRIVTATNRDLEGAVRAGTFREDLYYRLAVLPLRLPPLRERASEDLADLALGILTGLNRQTGRGPTRLSVAALARMSAYRWPGNIRELRNVLERVVLRAAGAEEVLVSHLPPEIALSGRPGAAAADQRTLEEVERSHIERVLTHHGGNRSRAARTLGISRATLYEKLAKYGLATSGRKRTEPPK